MGNSCCKLWGDGRDAELVKISTHELQPWELSPGSLVKGNEAGAQIPLRWSKGRVIAEGGFGQVFAGLNLDSGQPIAIKQVLIPEFITKKDLERVKEIEDEIAVLSRLRHPNIVQYLGTKRTEDSLNIFLEYAGGGSVTTLLEKYGPFPESVIQASVHGIAHRDIKGGNVLVTDGGIIKLADFGASKQRAPDTDSLENAYQSLKGTPCFMAPEVIRQEGYGNRADIWSVGCTVIEMATGSPPWSEKRDSCTIMFNIVTAGGPPTFPKQISSVARDFLTRCLERNPIRRATAMELLEHPFLVNVKSRSPEIVAQVRAGSFNASQGPKPPNPIPTPPPRAPSRHPSSQGSSAWRSRYVAAATRSTSKSEPHPSNLMSELRDVLHQRRVSQRVNDFSPETGQENPRPLEAGSQASSRHSTQNSQALCSRGSRHSGEDSKATASASHRTPPLAPTGMRKKHKNSGLRPSPTRPTTTSQEPKFARSTTAPVGTLNQQCGVGMGNVMEELAARFRDGSLPVHGRDSLS
ncbi:hypothetical protein BSKO_00200 [Bryopsis sp. KO-2023]|nr:hypothetical protein BSKO_00200 [Bryopsis sp. KO-2023]